MKIEKYVDTQIIDLKTECLNLEEQFNELTIEKSELEKLLSDFNNRNAVELGELTIEILSLRKSKFKNDKSKFEEATKDENDYREYYNQEKKKQIINITSYEKEELKKKFRKCSILCHPDKVSDEYKEEAIRIFIALKAAYDSNNIDKVTEIYNELELGKFNKSKSDLVTEKEKLILSISILQNQLKNITNEIALIKESEIYNTIINIDNWENYFKLKKNKLELELSILKSEII